MNGDFGVEIDAALNERIAALRAAAEAARDRVDRGVEGLEGSAGEPQQRDIPPAADPSPMFFHDEPTVRVAAVSFDEGIPFPEENS